MENTNYNKYEEAFKHVKKIRAFHRHVLVYFIINTILLILKKVPILYISVDKQNADPGFIDWMDVNIWGTPILWGIGLLIHGLYVYRHKFSFFNGWEERKIQEIMDKDTEIESNKWE